MVIENCLCCWDKFVWWFSIASFWKHSYACFELIELVTSKLFWIFILFAWFIALKGLGCYNNDVGGAGDGIDSLGIFKIWSAN